MEYAACNVVYVDRNATEDRLVTRDDPRNIDQEQSPGQPRSFPITHHSRGSVDDNLRTLLSTFSEGWSCDGPGINDNC